MPALKGTGIGGFSRWSFSFSRLDAMIDERFDVRHALSEET
jgi:hypothetical protein